MIRGLVRPGSAIETSLTWPPASLAPTGWTSRKVSDQASTVSRSQKIARRQRELQFVGRVASGIYLHKARGRLRPQLHHDHFIMHAKRLLADIDDAADHVPEISRDVVGKRDRPIADRGVGQWHRSLADLTVPGHAARSRRNPAPQCPALPSLPPSGGLRRTL